MGAVDTCSAPALCAGEGGSVFSEGERLVCARVNAHLSLTLASIITLRVKVGVRVSDWCAHVQAVSVWLLRR